MSSTTEQQALMVPEKQGPFTFSTRPIPVPNVGEILVRVKAISLNPIDWKIQASGYMVENYPAVLGTDVAGEVAKVGDGVKDFSQGDRVFFQAQPTKVDYGAYQEYVLAIAETTAKIPDSLSYSQATTIPLTLATAAVGLFADAPSGASLNPAWDPKVQYPGRSALIIGGSSSVGHFAIQLLKFVGFSHIIAYASETHSAYLKAMGATSVIDRATTPIAGLAVAVANVCGKLDIAYDAISSPEGQEAAYGILADNGHLLSVRATPEAYVDKNEPRGRMVTSVYGSPHIPQNRAFGKTMYEKIGAMIEKGIITPTRLEELPNGLESIVDGLEQLKVGKVSGKKLVVCM